MERPYVICHILSSLDGKITGPFMGTEAVGALAFLPIKGGRSFARNLHMVSAYWGFVLMSVHLGLHWSMIMGMARRLFPKPSAVRKWMGRVLALMIAGYGIYAFVKRDIGVYMILRSHFVFFDYDEPRIFFYLDYIAVMGLFVFIGNYMCVGFRGIDRRKK